MVEREYLPLIKDKVLSFEEEKIKLRALRNWFLSDQGQDVGNAFKIEVASLSRFLTGETLLQLGDCGNNPWLSSLNYQYKWLLNSYFHSNCDLVCALNSLPIDRNSIDCLVIPLTMDLFTAKQNPIDEIDRVLKPMGYALFLGVNPMSLWGIFLRFGWRACFGSNPTPPPFWSLY